MKILHLNAGNETGGGMYHILSLLETFNREEFILGVLEKGELWKRANAAGIQTIHFAHKVKMSIPLLRKMKQYIQTEQIHYVHTHGPRANVYANILKKLVPFRWIVTVHSDPLHDFIEKRLYGGILSRLNLHAIKNADRIITVSKPFQRIMIDKGIEHGKITTALNGIDFQMKSNKSYSKRDFGFADDDFIFLMVARLEPVKGHQIALEAFAEILKVRENCQLILLGDGSLRQTLEDMAKDLKILQHVHFFGHRHDTEEFYRLADITLLTSFSEGFPLVLLESAREKTPIIATNVGSVGELLANHSLGWKVKPGDKNELIKAMKESLIADENGMLPKIGEQLYNYASTQFSLKTFADNIYNVYLSMDDIN